jgi:hypothetical protein
MYFSYLNLTTNNEKRQIATHTGYHVSAEKASARPEISIVQAGSQKSQLATCKIQKEVRKGEEGRTF